MQSAVRLARGVTGRAKVVKFRGGYHGHADCFLVEAGSGAATMGVPSSPGVPPGVAADTLVADCPLHGEVRLLVAVRFGTARLIDNDGGMVPGTPA